jgi:methionine biosynthesis protein MetW
MSDLLLRPDLKRIAKLVEKNSKVLDIGCEDGQLLAYLANEKQADARGIEIQPQYVSQCVQNGLSVIQGDANTDLTFYKDNTFDYVISSQMLQATTQPKEVLREMMRIGKHVIVSIPNFGHWYNRYYLTVKGRMPISKQLSYQWYETPNIHFCTALDFKALCKEEKLSIKAESYSSLILPNLLSKQIIFLLEKANA